MKLKCPACGAAQNQENNSGEYVCEYCGQAFTEEESKAVFKGVSRPRHSHASSQGAVPNEITSKFNSAKNPRSAEEIYKSAIDGVCCIRGDDGAHAFSGSGFLVDNQGYIITNCHVVTNEDHSKLLNNLTANFDGKEYKLEAVAVCKQDVIDCALMKIVSPAPKGMKALPVGNSDDVVHGQKVYAIGNSLGEGLCITSGIISDLHRIVFNCEAFMSDVATNHGNSGGPLFDEDGSVIAICVAGIDGAKGMNYFIPINLVMQAVGKYIK